MKDIMKVQHPQKSDIIDHKISKDISLLSIRPAIFIMLWYFFSFLTLFSNKFILETLKCEPVVLGTFQTLMTTTFGYIQMYLPLGMYMPIKRTEKPPNFLRNIFILGATRSLTILLGLVALKYIAISFTETVKSSAPLFTVFISRCMLGEHTSFLVQMSLVPIMVGLGLCSTFELSFNISGFIAALSTNLIECLQIVFSKKLISYDIFSYTPAELQFFASISSIVVLIPVCWLITDFQFVTTLFSNYYLLGTLFANGIFFHFQSITAYVLMLFISPVTYSVANTTKRALLIWLSVLIIGNKVTFLSGAGTFMAIAGVFLYNKARMAEERRTAENNVIPIDV